MGLNVAFLGASLAVILSCIGARSIAVRQFNSNFTESAVGINES